MEDGESGLAFAEVGGDGLADDGLRGGEVEDVVGDLEGGVAARILHAELQSWPGFANVDIPINKHFPIFERSQLEIRGEAFNLLNHPNYSNPVTAINSTSTFGRITSTATDARLLQIAAKITFWGSRGSHATLVVRSRRSVSYTLIHHDRCCFA